MFNTEKMFELYKVAKEHLDNCKTEVDLLTEYTTQVNVDLANYETDALDLTFAGNLESGSQELQSLITDFQNDLEWMHKEFFEESNNE